MSTDRPVREVVRGGLPYRFVFVGGRFAVGTSIEVTHDMLERELAGIPYDALAVPPRALAFGRTRHGDGSDMDLYLRSSLLRPTEDDVIPCAKALLPADWLDWFRGTDLALVHIRVYSAPESWAGSAFKMMTVGELAQVFVVD